MEKNANARDTYTVARSYMDHGVVMLSDTIKIVMENLCPKSHFP